MARRKLALLPDNDCRLREEISRIQRRLPRLLGEKVLAALVIGSVAEGKARDGSDVDVLLFLSEGPPRREHYRYWDRQIAPRMRVCPFPIQPIFVSRASASTSEPNLAAAIRRGILLWDRGRLFPRRRPWSIAS
ncbi:MAG: nucleotidyltransferase domain-containing protein [Planctomycetes bacterium]|nr:nucleotidyltransferase domain-containing protein [Planctomycetota bacterium]